MKLNWVEDTAFSLEAGEISEVIRSSYGFHVIRVDEKLAASTPTLDEMRDELAREAASGTKAREYADGKAAELVAAVEAGMSLEDAARGAGLTLERPPALRRRADGFIAGLGAAEDVMSAAFGLAAGESSPEIFDISGQKILIQVLERTEPSADEVANARSERRESLLIEKQNRTISVWLADFRTRLEESGRLQVNAELAIGG